MCQCIILSSNNLEHFLHVNVCQVTKLSANTQSNEMFVRHVIIFPCETMETLQFDQPDLYCRVRGLNIKYLKVDINTRKSLR